MIFKFKAQKPDGEIYEGEKNAPDKFALFQEIKKGGDVVITAFEAEEAKKTELFQSFRGIFGSVSMQDKINFSRNLGEMLKAGLPLSRALLVMEKQATNRRFSKILSVVNLSIKQGKTFHEALELQGKIFPPLFIAMVKSGEESGSLSDSLSAVSLQLEKSHELKKKVRGAMIYPSIVVSVMLLIGTLLMVFVVPGLTRTFEELDVELPLPTKIVIWTSNFISENFVVALFGLIIASVLAAIVFRTPKGKKVIDFFWLHVPIVKGLVRDTNTARTARTLSSLLIAGVDVVEALSITRNVVQNSYYKEVLAEAEKEIQLGNQLSRVFESKDIYPSFLAEMAAVGEETGRLAEMFKNVGVFYETEIDRRTKDMSTVIEPFLMVFIGVVVGFFAVAMITPMYTVMNTI
ncbi:MAG: type II secretion system F family protein [bacterium]|nr:type II secretion system F family protein [bacterium]